MSCKTSNEWFFAGRLPRHGSLVKCIVNDDEHVVGEFVWGEAWSMVITEFDDLGNWQEWIWWSEIVTWKYKKDEQQQNEQPRKVTNSNQKC